MKNKIWLLTEEYNQYDQYGEYFLSAFKDKPTQEQLEQCGIQKNEIEHVLNGGGRIKYEDQWYHLREEDLK